MSGRLVIAVAGVACFVAPLLVDAQPNITLSPAQQVACVALHDEFSTDKDLSERVLALNYFVNAVGMIAVLMCVYIAHHVRRDWVSESALVVLAGILLGGVFYLIDALSTGNDDVYVNAVRFDQETFITMLLPIIIFEAGYSLQHGGVMRQIGTVMAFAIPGTLLSTVIIGVILWGASSGIQHELYNASGSLFLCLTFGSLLSATDPVAVIAVLGSKYDLTKEPPLLYNLIFGESVLNDAVAIVLFHVFLDFVSKPATAANVFIALGTFLYVFILSMLLGYAFGCLSAVFLKYVDLTDLPHIEIIGLAVFAAGSYYLAEYLRLSGIMCIFITARLMGIYSVHNLSPQANVHASFLFKTLATVAEAYVFLFLGAAVWAYNHNWDALFFFVGLIIVLASRTAVVFPISWLFNCRRKVEPITMKMQIFMWFAGLRGAIAFGLCVMLVEEAEKQHKTSLLTGVPASIHLHSARMLLTTGLGIILFMVLVMGSLSGPVLRLLGLDHIDSRGVIEDKLAEDPEYQPKTKHSIGKRFMRWLSRVNDNKIRPVLQRGYTKPTADNRCPPDVELAACSSNPEGGEGV